MALCLIAILLVSCQPVQPALTQDVTILWPARLWQNQSAEINMMIEADALVEAMPGKTQACMRLMPSIGLHFEAAEVCQVIPQSGTVRLSQTITALEEGNHILEVWLYAAGVDEDGQRLSEPLGIQTLDLSVTSFMGLSYSAARTVLTVSLAALVVLAVAVWRHTLRF